MAAFTSLYLQVRCENCNKSLKNSIILQYHQLHCTPTQAHKSEKKNISSSSSSLASPAVEKKIIDSKRSNASPVDMILKKLTEKVHSSSTSSSTLSSPVTSPGSNYKFFKSKAGEEKSAESLKEEEEDEASKKMKDHIKSCRDKQISVSMKKISHSEIDIAPSSGKSKSATKSSSSLEATESPSATKKPEKKETAKASPLKTSSSKSSAKIAKPKEVVAKLGTAPKKNPVGRPAVKKSTTGKKKVVSSDSDSEGKSKKKRKSYTKDSSSDDDSEFEARTRKRTPTLYCFESCFEEESNEMIG